VGAAAAGGGSARPAISPLNGKPFIPVLGDWEGTVNGFPASFRLRYERTSSGALRYGIDKLVVLSPSSCPVKSSQYSEDVIDSTNPNPLARAGALGLTRFGFGGRLVGARSATLTRHYRAGACQGTLSWRMHPATRRPVLAGRWKIRYADGESGTFHVEAAGRLASAIVIPSAITSCNGLLGEFDLFIGPDGKARLDQRNLRASITFTKKSGSGSVSGRGCARLRFTVSR
jgi:hypothetical protein